MNLKHHLESKTNGPFILLLAVVVGLSLAGRLTPEAVDAMKYLGGFLMGVRAVANLPRNGT